MPHDSICLTSSLSWLRQRNRTIYQETKKIDSVLNSYCRLLIGFFCHCDLQAHTTFPSPVSDQAETEDATHVLTGLSGSMSVWVLTNCAEDALVLTGGALGGCCWVCAEAGAAGEVRLTYSDRSISNWGTQEPTNQTRAEHSQRSSTEFTGSRNVYRWKWRTDRQGD